MHTPSRLERGYMQLTNTEIWQERTGVCLAFSQTFIDQGNLPDALVWAEQAVKILEAAKAKVNT